VPPQEEDHLADHWQDEDFLPQPGHTQEFGQPAAPDWTAALALGLRVSAWWLGHSPRPLPVASTLTLGTLTTMVAVCGGPLAMVSIAVIETLLGLHELTCASEAGRWLAGHQDD